MSTSLLLMSDDELQAELASFEAQLVKQVISCRWTRSDIRRIKGLLAQRAQVSTRSTCAN